MLLYPTISKNISTVPVYCFDKLDGSNLRVEWTPKNGFSKWGTRKRLLDETDERFGQAIPFFNNTMAETLEPVLRKLRNERVTLFMEFYGDNSFAGYHEDETHRLSLFDVSLYKKGFMLPKEFLKTFDGVVLTPEMLYHGKANSEFVSSVNDGSLDGMTFEGVVCKSQELVRNRQVVFKVKNRAWLDKLKTKCGDDERLFQMLA